MTQKYLDIDCVAHIISRRLSCRCGSQHTTPKQHVQVNKQIIYVLNDSDLSGHFGLWIPH